MTPKTARAAIASALRATLPDGWSVYSQPHDAPSVPCVAILPRSPYRELLTQGGYGTSNERMRLRLAIVVNRAAGSEWLDVLDDAIDDVLEALDATTASIGWAGVNDPGMEQVNGVDLLSASIDIDVV